MPEWTNTPWLLVSCGFSCVFHRGLKPKDFIFFVDILNGFLKILFVFSSWLLLGDKKVVHFPSGVLRSVFLLPKNVWPRASWPVARGFPEHHLLLIDTWQWLWITAWWATSTPRDPVQGILLVRGLIAVLKVTVENFTMSNFFPSRSTHSQDFLCSWASFWLCLWMCSCLISCWTHTGMSTAEWPGSQATGGARSEGKT